MCEYIQILMRIVKKINIVEIGGSLFKLKFINEMEKINENLNIHLNHSSNFIIYIFNIIHFNQIKVGKEVFKQIKNAAHRQT